MANLRIALLGGSFNPIHVAHIALATYVLRHGWADQVWFLVSPHNPLKLPHLLAPIADRLEMVRLATQHDSRLVVCDIETRLPQPSYTYRTLTYLRAHYPEYQFTLMIGADNWHVFTQWRNYKDLLANYPLIIYPREGYNISLDSLPSTVRLLDSPTFSISSTFIREQLYRGEIPQTLPPKVRQYIIDKQLYSQVP